jgi:hypothetical protein
MGPNPGHREDLRAVLADMLEGRPETRPGLMFGFPAYYAAGKLAACVYGTGIGLRVPPEEATELRGKPTAPFEPYGRVMSSWTFLEPVGAEELREEWPILDAAIDRAQRDAGAK